MSWTWHFLSMETKNVAKLTNEYDIKCTGFQTWKSGTKLLKIPGLTLADGFTVKGIDVMKGPLRRWIRLQIVSYLLFCTQTERWTTPDLKSTDRGHYSCISRHHQVVIQMCHQCALLIIFILIILINFGVLGMHKWSGVQISDQCTWDASRQDSSLVDRDAESGPNFLMRPGL